MSKSSTSVTMKVLKLDDKVKAINIFDGGERCLAVAEEMGDGRTQIMKILLKKGEILTILKTMFPVQENVNILYFGNVNINQLRWDWFQDFVY
jgi:hypothetical protein